MTNEEPSRRRNGRILVIVAIALVLVVGGVGVFLLTRGGSSSGTDDPNSAAQRFTEVYQRGLNTSGRDVNVDEFAPVVCNADMEGLREAFSAKENPVDGAPQFKLSVKNVKTENDKGSFTISSEVTVPGQDNDFSDEEFGLVKEDGSWRVCGLGA
ncbi:hypothetical protein [Actinocrispum sp. NPDC049592]|uniref:Rv0361 family membrane protein n=1 Tax=Actinocrispum sp. NPDC049592 TaxID=3154835 RepID=UPI00342EBADA